MFAAGEKRRFWFSLLAVCTVTVTGCAWPRIPGFSSGGVSSVTNPLVARFRARGPKSENEKIAEATEDLKYPAETHLAHGRWQERLGNLVEARNSYEIALSHDSRSIDAVIGLARLDQLAGRNNKAEQGYLKALKMAPNNPQALDALGQYYGAQDQWDKAVEVLNSAMMAAPDESSYRYHLAVALARSGRVSESMPHFVKTIGEAEAHYNVGFILYEQGNLDGARQQLTQAILKKPELTVAQQMLDEVIHDQNDKFIISEKTPGFSETRNQPLNQPQQQTSAGRAAVRQPPAVAIGPSGQVTRSEWSPTGRRDQAVANKPDARNAAFPTLNAPDPFARQNPPAGPGSHSLTPEQLEQMKNQFGNRTGNGG